MSAERCGRDGQPKITWREPHRAHEYRSCGLVWLAEQCRFFLGGVGSVLRTQPIQPSVRWQDRLSGLLATLSNFVGGPGLLNTLHHVVTNTSSISPAHPDGNLDGSRTRLGNARDVFILIQVKTAREMPCDSIRSTGGPDGSWA